MTQKTVQCRLVAPESTRQALWALAADKNTPLINALIRELVNHSDFETWREKGRHPSDVVNKLCRTLKTDPQFVGQPSRFFMSAEKVVNYIFKSWFKIQRNLQRKLSYKQKCLFILKSDEELVEFCENSIDAIQTKAAQVLREVSRAIDKEASDTIPAKKRSKLIRNRLFKKLASTKQPLAQCAVIYLLKNYIKLPSEPEDTDKLARRRQKTEIQIQRLQDQLESRIPKGRDLTGEAWLETLLEAINSIPKDDYEYKLWQDMLLSMQKSTPFPILFETNEDLVWSKNEQGRICVRFNGLSEHTFQIYCGQRQLHWFKRFVEDQQTKRASKNQHSSALFALRSARISWQENDRKGSPWDTHYITLSCTVDVRLWSAEGTDEVRHEKAADVAKVLTRLNEKDSLTETQAGYARRLTSTLEKLDSPFERPSQSRYRGKAHIIAGISLGWDNPVTVALWNTSTQEVLAYRSLRQLLGKDYPLYRRHRREQQKQSHERHKAQKQGKGNRFGTSNLGEHIDRLLAKAIVAIAQQYSAGSIAVPRLDGIRDALQAEIEAKAEQKIPGYLEGQKRYSRDYKRSIHKWSYRRLLNQLASKATQAGLATEEVEQPMTGSTQDKAKAIAITAYESRQIAVQKN